MPIEDVKASEKIEEDRASAKYIYLVVIRILFRRVKYFRSYVIWCPALKEKTLPIRNGLRKSEVGHLDLKALALVFNLVYQNVLRLDISVNNPFLLAEVKSKEELLHYDSHFQLSEFLI